MNRLLVTVIFIFIFISNIFAEDINFFTRTNFSIAQFWEKQLSINNSNDDRDVFSNFLIGSIGGGVEWIIWDMGKKRGSRIYLKSGIDFLFTMAPTYMGWIPSEEGYKNDMTQIDMRGGAYYLGFDMDISFGGTFPKTDLIWGIGSVFYFTFPAYAQIGIDNFDSNERFAFFATPSILLGYDIPIKDTKYKITPQIRTGITTLPLIPNSLVSDYDLFRDYEIDGNGEKVDYSNLYNMYSGFYIDISVAFSFYSIEWKK